MYTSHRLSTLFSPALVQATKFTLYYPTSLPAGYKIDTKTVSQPSDGVVVFDIKGPKNNTIYISEETRPSEFDIGGFFEGFSDLHQYSITGGDIATGRIEGGRLAVGSMLNNSVWIIANTKADISPSQMKALIESLVSTSGERI